MTSLDRLTNFVGVSNMVKTICGIKRITLFDNGVWGIDAYKTVNGKLGLVLTDLKTGITNHIVLFGADIGGGEGYTLEAPAYIKKEVKKIRNSRVYAGVLKEVAHLLDISF